MSILLSFWFSDDVCPSGFQDEAVSESENCCGMTVFAPSLSSIVFMDFTPPKTNRQFGNRLIFAVIPKLSG
jgi:hypothetical protein